MMQAICALSLLEGGFDGLGIVVGQREGELNELLGHAGRAGNAERGDAGAGLDQQGVGVSVVAADELDNVFAPGGGAGEADGRHGGFGSGADEAQLADGGKRLDDGLGQIDFRWGGCAEAGALAGGVDDGFDDLGGGVAEQERSPGADVIDIRVAVGVVDVSALAAYQEGRFSADGAEGTHGRVDAAGDQLFGALLKLAGEIEVFGHGRS